MAGLSKTSGGGKKYDSRVSLGDGKTQRGAGKNQKRDKGVWFSRVNSADNEEAISGVSK